MVFVKNILPSIVTIPVTITSLWILFNILNKTYRDSTPLHSRACPPAHSTLSTSASSFSSVGGVTLRWSWRSFSAWMLTLTLLLIRWVSDHPCGSYCTTSCSPWWLRCFPSPSPQASDDEDDDDSSGDDDDEDEDEDASSSNDEEMITSKLLWTLYLSLVDICQAYH